VVAGEDRRLLAEGLGGRDRRASGEDGLGLDADGDHDAGRRGRQRVDVELVVGDGVRDVGEERVATGSVVVGRHAELDRIGGWLGEELVGELALPGGHGHERGHPGSGALGAVDVLKRSLGGAGPVGVGQHIDQRWLMRDEGGDIVGVCGDEGEGGDRSAAAGEQRDRSGVERRDDGVHVLRLHHRIVVAAVVGANAATEPARVVRDDRAIGEVRRERAEPAGVHGLADHHQHRPAVGGRQRSVDVVGQRGARHVERVVGGGHGLPITVPGLEGSGRSGAR
jgi:hypothetical protein